LELIQRFPLRPLHTEEELDDAIAVIDSLLDRADLDDGERDYLDVLSDLVEKYEEDHHPIPAASDGEILRFLLETHELSQVGAAKKTGIAESTISAVLAGKRRLNRAQIGKLAALFHVEPGVFEF
jgi:HTH-type transcriptional regulator/antitoxin HigA